MSAAAKKRANLKSGGTDKPAAEETSASPAAQEVPEQVAVSSMDGHEDAKLEGRDFEDNACFEAYMIKPSNLKDIWSTFKVKKAMFDFMQWYFRPKSSYEPERVDYNALNILAEYQTYNLEFLKNELALNDEQTANVLEQLWQLLEFDPDEKSIEVEQDAVDVQRPEQQQENNNNIAYLGDDMIDQEEEAFKILLKKKFDLFRKLTTEMLDHELEASRVTIEQMRRIAIYVHETYFRHLRLYDFVLKNTKLSEVKRVFIQIAEPKCGEELGKAMVLSDTSINLPQNSLKSSQELHAGGNSGSRSLAAAGGTSGGVGGGNLTDPLASQDGTINRDGIAGGEDNQDSVTDSDMEEALKSTQINRKARNVMHRGIKDWNNKIAAAITKDIDMDQLPKSGQRKR